MGGSMKPGLDESSTQDTLVVRDGDVYKKFSVVEEVFDPTPLKEELANLEVPKPTNQEVINLAKQGIIHPYYDPNIQQRIDWLKSKIAEMEAL